MGTLSAEQMKYLDQADTPDLLCILAAIMTLKADVLNGYSLPDVLVSKCDCIRAIKRIRLEQTKYPTKHNELESEIQFIRSTFLENWTARTY